MDFSVVGRRRATRRARDRLFEVDADGDVERTLGHYRQLHADCLLAIDDYVAAGALDKLVHAFIDLKVSGRSSANSRYSAVRGPGR